MTKVLVVRTSGDLTTVLRALLRIKKKLPELTTRTMMRWGKMLERDMKESAVAAGIKPFTGKLFGTGIEWRQRPKGRVGHLFMVRYGVALDEMSPHITSVHRRRSRLLAWARQASNSRISEKARLVENKKIQNFPLFVKPHPFIRRAWRRSRPKLTIMLKKQARFIQI